MKKQLLSVTAGLSVPYLEVNNLSRKVWDHLVTTTASQNGFLGFAHNRDDNEFDLFDDDDDNRKGDGCFSRVSCPAFYSGLLSASKDELAESRLEANYRTFAVARLPDTVSVARAIFR